MNSPQNIYEYIESSSGCFTLAANDNNRYICVYNEAMRSQNIFLFHSIGEDYFTSLAYGWYVCERRIHTEFWVSLSCRLRQLFCGHHSQYVRLNIQLKFYRRSVRKFRSTQQQTIRINQKKRGESTQSFLHIHCEHFFRHILSTRQSETSKKNCGSKISQILLRENQAATLVWSKISLWFSNRIIDWKRCDKENKKLNGNKNFRIKEVNGFYLWGDN